MSTHADNTIWQDIFADNNIKENIQKEHAEVTKLLVQNYPHIAAGTKCQTLSKEESQNFVIELSKKTSTNGYLHRLTYFSRILEYGRDQLQWNVYIPSLPAIIKREKNRFKIDLFALAQANQVATALIDDLANPAPSTVLSRYGQILLSAIAFGGLHKPSLQQIFLAALPNMYHLSPDQLVVPLTSDQNNIQLWFADPITHGLLLKWHRDYHQDSQFASEAIFPDRAIRAYLVHVGHQFDISVAALRQQCNDRLSLRISPYLIDYASGMNRSVSLSQACWLRLCTGQALQIEPQQTSEDSSTLLKLADHYSSQPTQLAKYRQYNLWKRLQKKVSKKNIRHAEFRHQIDIFLRKNGEQLLPALFYIAMWGIELVTHIPADELRSYPGREKMKLRPSSAITYMGDIARYLIAEAGDEDLAVMDDEELQDLYRETIALCPVATNRTIKKDNSSPVATRCAEALRRFHGFLQIRHGAVAVDFSGLVSMQKGQLSVDANLISYREYRRVQHVLTSGDGNNVTPRQTMQALVTMLGFFCGLRRGECLRLRLCDLHIGTRSVLLIRNNRYGRTKSLTSIRQIPIYALLNTESLQQLLNWHKKRCLEVGSSYSQALLFCGSDNHSAHCQRDLFGPVRQAMHQVTGDHSLRFHHLRHSFATWSLVRLIRHNIPYVNASFLADPAFSVENCQTLRTQLLANSAEGRKTLYELARLLGHDNPQTTLLHYVHLLDWLLAKSLSAPHCEPIVSVDIITELTGLSADQIYYQRQIRVADSEPQVNWRLSDYLPTTITIHASNKILCTEPDLTPLVAQYSNWRDGFINLQRIIPHVLSAIPKGESTAILARSLDLEEQTIQRWQFNANWIRALKTGRQVPRHINVVAAQKGVDVFPAPVKSPTEKALQQRIFATVAAMDQQQQSTVKKLLAYFLLNYSISAKGMQFVDETLVAAYLSRLRNLGIYKKEIFLTIYCKNANLVVLRSETNRLNKSYSDAGNISALSYKGEKDKRYPITVRVIDPENKSNDAKNGLFYSNYGFRSAIYLLTISLFDDYDTNSAT